MPKLKEKKIQIVDRDGQKMILRPASKNIFSFFDLFNSPKELPFPGKSVVKNGQGPSSKEDLSVVRSWVALEERIVHDYKERKSIILPPGKTPAFSPKPAQAKTSVFETLSIQTSTSVPPFTKGSPSGGGKAFSHFGTWILALGWLLAVGAVLFYAKEVPLRQDVILKLARNQGENKQLERFAAEYKAILGEQRKELQEANRRLRAMTGDLRAAQEKAAAYDNMEKGYRDELFRVTVQYEGQLEHMRQLLQARDDFSKTLREHIQAIDKLVSEGGLATAFGAAVAAVQAEKAKAIESARAAQQKNVMVRGKVVMVNSRYQFIVVDLGADQGARVGGVIDVFQGGKRMTGGRIEKVYPSMSAVSVFDEGALGDLREGDTVSFSPN